jgi:uncharacterized protein
MAMPNASVPNLRALLDAVDAGATHKQSMIHGEGHWKCVAWTGLQLLPEVPGCDAAVLYLFSLLHDTQRLDDGHDPRHGPRAAIFAEDLHRRRLIVLPSHRLRLLNHACHDHTAGTTSADPTLGACWDADRLNLWRVGIRPDPRWLSTSAARSPQRIERAGRFVGQHMTWQDLFRRYAEAVG